MQKEKKYNENYFPGTFLFINCLKKRVTQLTLSKLYLALLSDQSISKNLLIEGEY